MSRLLFPLLAVIATITLIIIWSDSIISSKAVPSLGEYLASTTQATSSASSTVAAASPVLQAGEAVEYSTLVRAPKGIIHAYVASTTEEFARGLGGRTSLLPEFGMLFNFPISGSYGFWMKDMHFPIDIIWLNSSKIVTGITRNVRPESYPTTFHPPGPVSHVLEVNAGKSATFGIATGTALVF